MTNATGLDLICLGEPMVEFNAQPDGRWLYGFGGDVSNVAVAAARQGAKVGMATRIGADSFGDDLLDLWRTEGVDVAAVTRDEDAPTGVYFVRHGPEGHLFEYRRAGSAASRMSAETAPRDAIAAARCLHYSGISQAISAD
ncbi:MAG: PfkB family carbohydrate kinase, partial [Pseudomonadota bacterium]